ncbi:hypothetical protein ALTERO38_52222 [Alteromonas sp. 38]|nr:hypothetical protein ALTER154_50005 [Alteromonas sp. 154]VXC03565.1 hypothetical protein ALTERO38_52222 [Alteromonas sp. 38]
MILHPVVYEPSNSEVKPISEGVALHTAIVRCEAIPFEEIASQRLLHNEAYPNG